MVESTVLDGARMTVAALVAPAQITATSLGPASDPITVGFARRSEVISRLRHRQFGVFITTSHFNQAGLLRGSL